MTFFPRGKCKGKAKDHRQKFQDMENAGENVSGLPYTVSPTHFPLRFSVGKVLPVDNAFSDAFFRWENMAAVIQMTVMNETAVSLLVWLVDAVTCDRTK